ncbi:AraC family transcriptional regulator [Dyadobacter sp. CY356]|uniref:helix-turn-helix domain-containing protein n=1 Tax=Dyadobacter sp. CY356 TaxID=2906442 RepID=UPI001F200748|nr:helix-turn-helix transcriptional regulator [Dyadobacter sp. CY356]MCF0055563.1 helix-turn-helix transcriptional regulator [Dyadobacter sp. CY356]
MRKKTKSIPVNVMTDDFGGDISVEKISVANLRALEKVSENSLEDAEQSHRHDRHSFFLLESGIVSIEIDFQKYDIQPSSVIYMHPNQVHRMLAFEHVTVYSCAINNENLNPEYLKLLETISPAKPILLDTETFSVISQAASFAMKLSERKNEKLYHFLLKDSCNTLVALIISQYLHQSGSSDKLSRFETVTKGFKELLEREFINIKKPAEYAQNLNISTPYLNECVKNTTGHSVSYHIQERIILEAKRLLFHSNKSVKEIATELGYDDYPYFTRLFTKVTGMTAVTFRNKNHD